MNNVTLYRCLLFLILLSIISCNTSEAVKRSPEYTSGKRLADVYAKNDAMKSCSRKRGKVLNSVIQKHIEAMGNDKSEDFKSGFSDGYRIYFFQYADTFCIN